jgi:nucleoside-diphosphate-sugar epimerase
MTGELLVRGHDVVVLDDGNAKRHTLNQVGIHERMGVEGCGELVVVEGSTNLTHSVLANYLLDFDRIDRIIHAGASTGIPYSGDEPLDDWERNATGTLSLLEWLRHQETPPPTVILSSVKPYRVTPKAALTGHDPLEPEEPYAASKAAQSHLAMAWGRSYGLPVLTYRCSNLWGPAAPHGPRHGWLTWFCISAAIGLPIEVQGTGSQARDMLWWTDVLNACDKGHSSLEAGQVQGGDVLTIGGGKANMTSVGQAARKLHKLTGCKVVERPDAGRRFEDQTVCVDNEAANRALMAMGGFSPQAGVDSGLRTMLDWARRHRDELLECYR